MKYRLLIATLLLVPSSTFIAQDDTTKHIEDADTRARVLLQKMTLDEKIGQMTQLFWDKTLKDDRVKSGQLGSYLFLTDPKEINRVQHIAVDQTRLHIPLLMGFDVIHGFRTTFPVPIAQAASWDPALNEAVQSAAAEEASAVGIRWAFAPMVDIARDARWGRIVEGAGEDPYLGSVMAAARVRGFQGKHLNDGHHIIACAKHFAGYGAAEGGRDYDSVYLSDTQLENVYLPPFKSAVDAGAGCIMSAYMDLNDIPASGNHFLLHDVLRDRWKFNGFVVTDAWTVYNLVAHGFAKDYNDAAERALKVGVNMDMGSDTYFRELPKLLAEKKITMVQIDDAVLPLLRAKYAVGLFDHPYVDESAVETRLHEPRNLELARTAAIRSAVLLRNEGGALPLKKEISSIAVIGPLADQKEQMLGSWIFAADKDASVTVLEGIRTKVGPSVKVNYALGTAIKRAEEPALNPDKLDAKAENEPDAEIAKAVETARSSDVVVMVLGETDKMSGEYASRSSLRLPGKQELLLEAVASTGKPVVLVLINGRPLDINWASTHVPAILEAWFPGQQGGNAIADLLFGDASPAGKLPLTWPRNSGQEPLYYNHNLTQVHEDSPNFAPYYWDTPHSPLYPFGYGLSYSTFAITNLRLSSKSFGAAGIDATVDVENTGKHDADEVVQLYTHQQWGSASRPIRELKAFQRIALRAGEKRTITLHLAPQELSMWSPQTRRRAVEASSYDVWVGDSSRATLHESFSVGTEMPQ